MIRRHTLFLYSVSYRIGENHVKKRLVGMNLLALILVPFEDPDLSGSPAPLALILKVIDPRLEPCTFRRSRFIGGAMHLFSSLHEKIGQPCGYPRENKK